VSAWHLEIRSAGDGRTLCSADVEARKVSEIEAVKSADTVGILLKGETVAVGYPSIAQAKDGRYELYRWPIGEEKDAIVTKVS